MMKPTCYKCPLLVFFCRNHSASHTPPSICAPYNCIAAGYNELCPLHDINSSHEPEAEAQCWLLVTQFKCNLDMQGQFYKEITVNLVIFVFHKNKILTNWRNPSVVDLLGKSHPCHEFQRQNYVF